MATFNSQLLVYQGIYPRSEDRLRSLREHEAVLASAKGDLSIMGILLQRGSGG